MPHASITPEKLAALQALMQEAGALMLRVPAEVRDNPDSKAGSANFVTDYDVRVQTLIKDGLARLFPTARFLAEEDGASSAEAGEGLLFIIDPIDGTTNFMCGYNTSAVSVGLLADGEPIFGAVYDPYRDEFFSATRGGGATCNGAPIRVSARPIERAITAIGSAPYQKAVMADTMLAMTRDLFLAFADFRRSGSAALDICHVAAGRVDAFCEPMLAPWDYAAGILILTEAGGLATDFAGGTLPIVAPSPCVFGSPTAHPVALAVTRRHAAAVDEAMRRF